MTFENRLRAVIAAIVLCWTIGASAGASDVNVVGTWKGSMDTQMGAVDSTITIETAKPLAGTLEVGEYKGKLEKATLEGDKIAFQLTIDRGTISYEGTVSGDEMKLDVTGTTGNKMTLVAKRQK